MNQKLDYSRQYNRWHSNSPEHIQNMKELYRTNISRYLPSDTSIRILDVGCGMGFAILFLQEIGYTYVQGIDVDCSQVESCLSMNLDVSQVENSVDFLKHNSNTYDLILALDVIEHIQHADQLNFVQAIQAALKPGGKLICTVPNANSILASRWRYIDWTHHLLFTEYSLDFLLFNAGFEQIKVYGIEYFHTPPLPNFLSSSILKRSFWSWLLSKPFRESITHWGLFKAVRSWQRIVMISELGWEQGASLPISPNILAVGVKSI